MNGSDFELATMILLLGLLVAFFYPAVDALILEPRRRRREMERILENADAWCAEQAKEVREASASMSKRLFSRTNRNAWWKAYQEYLASPEWQTKRARILQRDRYRCTGCRVRAATEVHHLTYVRVGQEWDTDLTSLCEQCHKRHHPNNAQRPRRL